MKKIIAILIIFLIGGFVLYGYNGISSEASNEDVVKIFTVEKGSSLRLVANNLEKENLIKDSALFIAYASLANKDKNIQAGEYLLSPQMNIIQIINMLKKGETNKKKLTILEGWDINDIANYFEEKGISTKEETFNLIGRPTEVRENKELEKLIKNFNLDKPNNISLEGYIFPDTYYIESTDKLENIILQNLNNWDKKITPHLRDEIKRQEKKLFEIIIVASMIEKEARTIEDKKDISNILWKRLEIGMPLQICATVLYSLPEKKSKVSTADTQFDSLYNTYKYNGLPLGPICNPGMDSILAAIYPNKNNYWYYLSSNEGEIFFSKTLEEHNYKKNIYIN
jgi:UPF0755 protein